MGLSERSASSLDTIAGHAERVYSVAEGATLPLGMQAVLSSWQRSAKKHGLDPLDSQAPRIVTPAELKHFREPLDKLIFTAQQEIDELYEVVREAAPSCSVIALASRSRIVVKMRWQASSSIGELGSVGCGPRKQPTHHRRKPGRPHLPYPR
jgi:transcriptional regulator of acetoin/glycerol metabolism